MRKKECHRVKLLHACLLLSAACDGVVILDRNDPDGSPHGRRAGASCNLADVEQIFVNYQCVSCHDSSPEFDGGGLDLVSDGLVERLVGAPSRNPTCGGSVLVDPVDAERSVLLRSIAPERFEPYNIDACTIPTMPFFGTTRVSPEDVDCLETWIRTLEADASPETAVLGDAFSVLSRTKYILHGGAITADELAAVSAPDGTILNDELESVVANWLETDESKEKIEQFLRLMLQQSPSDTDYYRQFRNTAIPTMSGWRSNMDSYFVRTAMGIVERGDDFRSIANTTTFEATTGVLLALKTADNRIWDSDRNRNIISKDHHCLDMKDIFRSSGIYPDHRANTSDWRTITMVHDPNSTHMLCGNGKDDPLSIEYEDRAEEYRDYLQGLQSGDTMILRAPRVGFFTTPAFFQLWQSNNDNLGRVWVNQALIVALGRQFSSGDPTPINVTTPVDTDEIPENTDCYGCHEHLDPMANVMLQTFDPLYSRYEPNSNPGPMDFSFQGHSRKVSSVQEWANALAESSGWKSAWVNKICNWAASTDCDELDPRAVKLADEFEASGFDLKHLIIKFFASPYWTDSSNRDQSSYPGAQATIVRRGHYCHSLRTKLTEVLASDGRGYIVAANVCDQNDELRTLSGGIPNDSYTRGQVNLEQPSTSAPLTALAYEGTCALSAPRLVANNGVFRANNPERVLDQFVEFILGRPKGSTRFEHDRQTLGKLYEVQTLSPACDSSEDLGNSYDQESPNCGMELESVDALRNIWTMVCESPAATILGVE